MFDLSPKTPGDIGPEQGSLWAYEIRSDSDLKLTKTAVEKP